MKKCEFDEIRKNVIEKIKKIFGNKISDMEIYDIAEVEGHWAFKVGFYAYNYFFVVFNYELDIIGFSIEVGNGRLMSIADSHSCYSGTDMDSYIRENMKNIELRIPDKYLKARGWG